MGSERYDVFISYRRAEAAQTARLLQRCLQDSGLSVFLDVDELGAGHFDESLLATIKVANDFIVILSPGCFDRCTDPGDWFRREIGTALASQRNVVPVAMPGFFFPSPEALPDDLRSIVRHQGVSYSHEYFDAMLQKLVRYLRSRPANASSRPGPPATLPPAQTNSLGNKLVLMPAESRVPSEPVGRCLYVCCTSVSNRDYRDFVRAGGPPPHVHPKHPDQHTWTLRDCPVEMLDHPVVYVTQADARNFCVWLTRREQGEGRLSEDERYTLPTFDQWKAVTQGARVTEQSVLEREWIAGQYQPTAPVGRDPYPSPLGLHHVLGNVFQWCLDERKRKIRRADRVEEAPFYLAVGGGWASGRDWLERSIRQGTYGAIWCPYGRIMKDGGFRICLQTNR